MAITINCRDCGAPQEIHSVRCATCSRKHRAELVDVVGDIRVRVADILAAYFDGPMGEPNIADAHDFLLRIQEEIDVG